MPNCIGSYGGRIGNVVLDTRFNVGIADFKWAKFIFPVLCKNGAFASASLPSEVVYEGTFQNVM